MRATLLKNHNKIGHFYAVSIPHVIFKKFTGYAFSGEQFLARCTKYKESYCSHPSRPHSRFVIFKKFTGYAFSGEQFLARCTKYKESYCSHPSRPHSRFRHTVLKFYMKVFQKFISQQPLVREHSYLDHRYPGGSAFITWLPTPGSMPRGGARGQNLGHL